MLEIIKTFRQQAWNEQLDVKIHKDGVVSVNDIEANTPREKALANIILRLNSHSLILHGK